MEDFDDSLLKFLHDHHSVAIFNFTAAKHFTMNILFNRIFFCLLVIDI